MVQKGLFKSGTVPLYDCLVTSQLSTDTPQVYVIDLLKMKLLYSHDTLFVFNSVKSSRTIFVARVQRSPPLATPSCSSVFNTSSRNVMSSSNKKISHLRVRVTKSL